MKMNTDERVVWKKGSLKLTIDSHGESHTYVSKKEEPPSSFLARVLRTSKMWGGDQVWNYLKSEMEENK